MTAPRVPAAARHRTRQLRLAFAVIPPATHAVQAGMFALLWAHDPLYGLLSAFSVLAVGWFAVAGLLHRRGATEVATWMTWLEVLVHSAVLHVAFGSTANLFLYPLILSAASLALFPADQPVARRLGTGIAFAAAMIEYLVGRLTTGWIEDPWVVERLGAVNAVTAAVIGMLFVVVLLSASERAELDAEAEAERAETLLRNVLPARIAERLKSHPGGIAEQMDEATVLFADLAGFTPMAASRSAAEVVAILDRAFTAFDAISARHGLEKIKTIGDAYMAVAGVPDPHDDGAAAAARVALELLQATAKLSRELGVDLQLRVGLHTGPVVAGVIGTHRMAFDLWGDTVNTASRMESHGEPGRIHLTAATADRLRDRFVIEDRGIVTVKGKGDLATAWLAGPR